MAASTERQAGRRAGRFGPEGSLPRSPAELRSLSLAAEEFGQRADHPYYRRLECLQPAVFAARQTPGEDRGHAAVAPIVTPCDLSSCPGCLPVLGAGSEYVVRSAWGVPSFAVLTVGTPRAMEWAQAGDGLLQRSKRVLYEAKAAVMVEFIAYSVR
ncbi:uncharacterized protein LOC135173901 isoform X2 [Pogoniulus pusillus]|uniref:uncharacterized protein LOC135173901 isoform X2 n=1 Tax=Pogoniulus pusillus TaxID=488313 RepID=UPI0030B9A366